MGRESLVPQEGSMAGTRQATSAYACGDCAALQSYLGITNVTGTEEEYGQYCRLYYD